MAVQKNSGKKFSFRRVVKIVLVISLCIQCAFILYFFFRVSQHMPDGGRQQLKLCIAICIAVAMFIIYFKWLRRYSWIHKLVSGAFQIVLYLHAAMLVYIVLLKWINPPVTFTQLSSLVSGYGLKRDYVSYSAISYNMKLSVIASEDQTFPDHNGFDWNAIERSFNPPKKKKNRKKKMPPGTGASTISQQVAKNIFLWQGKSYFRKGLEAYFTFMIETVWGKKRILAVYLNSIEMGKGIFGIEAAAQAYFNKPANQLSRLEAALITACFPNPKVYRVNPPSPYMSGRSRAIMTQMNYIEDDDELQEIIK